MFKDGTPNPRSAVNSSHLLNHIYMMNSGGTWTSCSSGIHLYPIQNKKAYLERMQVRISSCIPFTPAKKIELFPPPLPHIYFCPSSTVISSTTKNSLGSWWPVNLEVNIVDIEVCSMHRSAKICLASQIQ